MAKGARRATARRCTPVLPRSVGMPFWVTASARSSGCQMDGSTIVRRGRRPPAARWERDSGRGRRSLRLVGAVVGVGVDDCLADPVSQRPRRRCRLSPVSAGVVAELLHERVEAGLGHRSADRRLVAVDEHAVGGVAHRLGAVARRVGGDELLVHEHARGGGIVRGPRVPERRRHVVEVARVDDRAGHVATDRAQHLLVPATGDGAGRAWDRRRRRGRRPVPAARPRGSTRPAHPSWCRRRGGRGRLGRASWKARFPRRPSEPPPGSIQTECSVWMGRPSSVSMRRQPDEVPLEQKPAHARRQPLAVGEGDALQKRRASGVGRRDADAAPPFEGDACARAPHRHHLVAVAGDGEQGVGGPGRDERRHAAGEAQKDALPADDPDVSRGVAGHLEEAGQPRRARRGGGSGAAPSPAKSLPPPRQTNPLRPPGTLPDRPDVVGRCTPYSVDGVARHPGSGKTHEPVRPGSAARSRSPRQRRSVLPRRHAPTRGRRWFPFRDGSTRCRRSGRPADPDLCRRPRPRHRSRWCRRRRGAPRADPRPSLRTSDPARRRTQRSLPRRAPVALRLSLRARAQRHCSGLFAQPGLRKGSSGDPFQRLDPHPLLGSERALEQARDGGGVAEAGPLAPGTPPGAGPIAPASRRAPPAGPRLRRRRFARETTAFPPGQRCSAPTSPAAEKSPGLRQTVTNVSCTASSTSDGSAHRRVRRKCSQGA